jgi:hypothetical protein
MGHQQIIRMIPIMTTTTPAIIPNIFDTIITPFESFLYVERYQRIKEKSRVYFECPGKGSKFKRTGDFI